MTVCGHRELGYVELSMSSLTAEELPWVHGNEIEVDPIGYYGAILQRQGAVVEAAPQSQIQLHILLAPASTKVHRTEEGSHIRFGMSTPNLTGPRAVPNQLGMGSKIRLLGEPAGY